MSKDLMIAAISFNATLVITSSFYAIRVAMRRDRDAAKLAALRSAVNAYEDHVHAYGVCPVHMPILVLILPIFPRTSPRYRMGATSACRRCLSDRLHLIKKDGDGGVVHRFPVHLV